MFTRSIFESESEWLEGRGAGIGGSDAAAIVGNNPFKNNQELWREKVGIFKPDDISDKPWVQYGNKAEPLLREMFKIDFPEYKVYHREYEILRNNKYDFMQASVDGELEDEQGRKGILEIKTTTIMSGSQLSDWKGRIPQNYYCQILHYLNVTGYDYVILKAQLAFDFTEEKKREIRHYMFERKDCQGDLEFLAQEERKFWTQVEKGEEPGLMLPPI